MRINPETSVGIFVIGALAVFLYMTVQIGVFQLDMDKYRKQVVYFNDISGLIKKADVKIAGVKVGWIVDISLNQKDDGTGYTAEADIMIDKRYIIRADGHGVVRQDGLLGVKYLEIIPGDPALPALTNGDALGKPGKSPVSVDELLQQAKSVATNIEEISGVIRDALVSPDQKSKIKDTVDNIYKTSEKLSRFSTRIDTILVDNQDDIEGMVRDFRGFAAEMREAVPLVQSDVHELSQHLSGVTLPGIDRNVDRVASAFERDFDAIANKLESTADAIEQAALQTRDGFKGINSVANKINDGHGLIGKLINDDEVYYDFKKSIQGLRNYFSRVESMATVFDSHSEMMYGPLEGMNIKNNKGYFDIRIHSNEDTFYILQVMSSIAGKMSRVVQNRTFYDTEGYQYNVPLLAHNHSDVTKIISVDLVPGFIEKTRTPDALALGFQIGKVYKDVAFRFGMMEGSFGVACDYEIPFESDLVRWVSSFEMFDFRGRERFIDDQRPHLKWINKVFLCRNLYVNFGADDFVSLHNANGFFGMGLRFADDDLKYLISQLGLSSFTK